MSARVAAWSLAVFGISLNALYLGLDRVNEHRDAPPPTGTIVGIAFLVVGAFIASNRPRNPIGWIYLVGLTLVSFGGSGNVSEQYAYYALVSRPGALPAPEWLVLAGSMSLATGFTALVLFSLLLFPDGRLPSPRWRLVAAAAVGAVALMGIVTAFAPENSLTPSLVVANPIQFPAAAQLPDQLGGAIGAFVIGVLLACLAAPFVRFRAAVGVERQQLKWFAYGAMWIPAVALVGAVGVLLAPEATFVVGGNLWPLSVAGIPIATAIAILRLRLYDLDLVIERTLVYGALSAALAATYWVLVLFLQAALRPVTAGSELAVAASTLAALALVQPLRARIQRSVDRRFYRARYDAAHTLDDLSVRLRDEVALDAVRTDLLEAVGRTMHPTTASLWLRQRESPGDRLPAGQLRRNDSGTSRG